jgi:hypothetical protein
MVRVIRFVVSGLRSRSMYSEIAFRSALGSLCSIPGDLLDGRPYTFSAFFPPALLGENGTGRADPQARIGQSGWDYTKSQVFDPRQPAAR